VEGNGEPTPLLELGLGSNGSHPGIRSRGDLGVDPLDLFSDWKVSKQFLMSVLQQDPIALISEV
jgi:hypothetical protein